MDAQAARLSRRACLVRGVGALGGLVVTLAPAAWAQTDVLRRQIRFTLLLSNPLAQVLENQVVWLYMPAARTATQSLDGLKVSMSYELSTDALGHSVMQLAFPRFAPWASKVVGITADVLMHREPLPEVLPDPSAWLRAERYIEVNDTALHALAAQLRRSTERETALAIYAWVRRNLQYAGYVADDLGALAALVHRRGDCTEYAFLAVALARANGIPARMVGGYFADHSVAPRAEDYHNWAEVHVEGAWRLLDAQKENWLSPVEQYVAFRIYRDQALNPIGLAHRFRVEGQLQVRV
jgi:transglutaminase-like putative cysteine protease